MAATVEADLERIVDRVGSLVRTVHALREENRALRTSLEHGEAENRDLKDRLSSARTRVESLLHRLPPDA